MKKKVIKVMSLLDETFNDAELGNEDFKVLLEDHLEILKSDANLSRMADIAPIDADRFEYDFYGVLRLLNIQPKYYWVVMRVNNLHSPTDYRRNMLSIRIPDFDSVEKLYNYFKTINKKSAG